MQMESESEAWVGQGSSIASYKNILGDLGEVIDPFGNPIQTIYPFPDTYTHNVLYNFEVCMDFALSPSNSCMTV